MKYVCEYSVERLIELEQAGALIIHTGTLWITFWMTTPEILTFPYWIE
jgi:hypothetical protein